MSDISSKAAMKKALLAVIFAALVGGGIPVMGKISLVIVPPTVFTFLRFLIATLCMAPFALPLPKIDRGLFVKILLVCLFATLNVTLFPFGIRLTTATIGQLLYAAAPIVILILSHRFLKEEITRKKIIGIGTGLFGVVILVLLPVIDKGSLYAGTLLGNVIIFTALVSFSFYSTLSKQYQKYATPVQLTFIFALLTTLLIFPIALREHIQNPVWITKLSISPIIGVLYVGVLGGAAYYLAYQYAIKKGGTVIASLTLFIQPLATYVWALILLNEKLIPGVIVGAVFTILGAKIVTQRERKV